jgi:hypothetical protein
MKPLVNCLYCIYLLSDKKCAAFADKIPDEILLGENDHSKSLPNQENNIVFEAIKKTDS